MIAVRVNGNDVCRLGQKPPAATLTAIGYIAGVFSDLIPIAFG